MSRPLTPVSSRRPRLLLFGSLIVLALVYLGLKPALDRMGAETARMKRERDANQAQSAHFKDLRSAFDQARERAGQNPKDAGAQREMAQRCEEAGNLGESLQYAESAARLQPQDVNVLLTVASLSQRLKHYDTAVEAYRQTLAIAPNEPRALAGVGYLYVLFGWPLVAERLLMPAVQQQPNNPQLKVCLAMAYVQHENSVQAERLLLEVKRAAPGDAALWTPLVDVYMQEKRYAEALRVAGEALQQTPDNKAVQELQAQAYYYLDDLDKARQSLQRLLAADPNDATAYYYLGLCANKAGDVPQAIRQMEASLERNPGSDMVKRVLGQLYLRTHRDDEGRKLTEEANRAEKAGQKRSRLNYQLANHPDSVDAHRQMAQVYEEQKDLPRAIVEWKQTLHYQPGDTQARAALHTTLQAAGRGQEANTL